MSDDSLSLPYRKIEVLYNDIVGDIKNLLDRTDENMKLLQATLAEYKAVTKGFLDDVSFRSLDLKQSAGQIVFTSGKSIEEEAKRAEMQIMQKLAASAVEAVSKSAHEATQRALAQPMGALTKAYTELSAKAKELQNAVNASKQRLMIQWGKVLGIAALTLVLGGTIAIFVARQLEAWIPAISVEDQKTLSAGHILQRAWGSLDPKTQETILNKGNAVSDSSSSK
jgi:hypothetical protein